MATLEVQRLAYMALGATAHGANLDTNVRAGKDSVCHMTSDYLHTLMCLCLCSLASARSCIEAATHDGELKGGVG